MEPGEFKVEGGGANNLKKAMKGEVRSTELSIIAVNEREVGN